MNAKQTIPIVATLAPTIAAAAPALLLIGGIAFVVWLLSDDKKKPEISPDSSGNIADNRGIPANSSGNPSLTPAPVLASSIPAAPKIPVASLPNIPPEKITPEISLPVQKKFITRQNMAKIFSHGCGLPRKSAVAALQALGFGKTAAYAALSSDGRFSAWLQFAPDGIITWKG